MLYIAIDFRNTSGSTNYWQESAWLVPTGSSNDDFHGWPWLINTALVWNIGSFSLSE